MAISHPNLPQDADLLTGLREEDLHDDDLGQSLFQQLQGYGQIILRRKLLILLVLTAGVASGYFFLKQQRPVYRATTTILIDRSTPKILSNVNEIVELGSPRDYRGDILYFESQYHIIKSREVTERVIDRLGLWHSEHLLGLDVRDDLTEEERRKALEDAHMPTVLAERLNVEPVTQSMLVLVHFEDTDPQLAQDVVNAVAEAYRDQNLDYRRNVVADATRELQSLQESLATRLAETDDALRTYEREHEVGTIPNSKKGIDDRLGALGSKLTEVRLRRIELEAKANAIRAYTSTTDIDRIANAAILEDAVIRSLKEQIAEQKARLRSMQTRYLDKHPEVAAIKERLGSLTRSARLEIQNVARAVQREYEQVKTVEEGVRAELEAAKAEERRIADVERQWAGLVELRDQAKQRYEGITKRLEDAYLSRQIETNNIRVLEPAVQAERVRPRKATVMAWFVAGSLALAVLLVFLFEYADATIKDWKELEERLGYKVLGVLPVITSPEKQKGPPTEEQTRERDLYIHRHPKSAVAEASRALRTNLLFMGTAKPIRSLMVTSADPSEGKSTVAINTAVSLATSGTRVLLVESDMRRPRFTKTFQLEPDKGLTACLAAGGPLEAFTQATEVAGLDVLVCGPIPPNPAELLHSEMFMEVKAAMEARYDVVVFDTPPVLPVADALVLASQVDAALVVVRAGRTSRHALRHAVRSLRGVNAHILGTVLNYREQPRARYGYGSRYGYGYGYGYGYRYGKAYAAEPDAEAEGRAEDDAA